MKILFLAPYPPFPPHGGGQQRIFQMLRLLADRHELRLLTFTPAEVAEDQARAALAPLRKYCAVETVRAPAHTIGRRLPVLLFSTLPDMALRGQEPRFATALKAILARERFDVVQVESIEMVQYGQIAKHARRAGGAPLMCYDAFNAEHLLQRRAFLADLRQPHKLPVAGYSWLQWQKLRRYEQRLARDFDLAFAVSEADRNAIGALATGLAIDVVPNGVDTTFFRRGATEPGVEPRARVGPFILFTGTLDFRPNVDAVTWFVHTVWEHLSARHPELRFCVVGQRPPETLLQLAAIPGVEIVGAVDDVRPWFERAAAYVLPMRVGGGVRLKLLETWAMELPCVTTSLGADGVAGFEPGTHALVADEPSAFLAGVERLLRERDLAERIAASGRQLVVERYDWAPIVGQMEHVWVRQLERLKADRLSQVGA